MAKGTTHEHSNRLIDETSPYLLQHAHNPVDWYPWGPEALERARKENKPILLSIGYSACHWCHVMERESFENDETAALMNQHFINIKVDREERPDLDEIYMAATVTLNHGQGGWPMTVFLTPSGIPYFAGTYFPPEDRMGMPSFRAVLQRMAELWETQRDLVRAESVRLAEHLRDQAQPEQGSGLGETELRRAIAIYARDFDETNGGFGGAPKFPPSMGLSLILRYYSRSQDEKALRMVTRTLDAMAAGGIYDHVGGGFARYATDEQWLVPHFEKMLYDNALLAKVYLEGLQVTGEEHYRRVAIETLDWVLREMTDESGGFHSALDADSEGEEGKFYVWSPDELTELLGEEDAQIFCEYYDITTSGNWEGVSIPNTRRARDLAARQVALEPDAMAARVAELRPRVLAARDERVRPAKDDKILTAWNGLTIGALAEGARILGESRYLVAARRAADFLLAELVEDGHLLRTWRAGKAHLRGVLEDYAYLAEGLLDLYEAGGGEPYLRRALELAEAIRTDFSSDENRAFCTIARNHEELILRRQEGHDGATPNPNATAAHVLARLAYHLGRDDLRESALAALDAHSATIARMPRGFAKSLIAVDLLLEGPIEIVVAGAPDDPATRALAEVVNATYLPRRVLAPFDPSAGEPPEDLPLLEGKTLQDGKPVLYICRDFTCDAPITDPEQAAAALSTEQATRAGQRHALAALVTVGKATPEATQTFANDVGGELTHGFATLGSTGLVVSRFGFGGYRVDDQTDVHSDALGKALLEGINLIDTSTNYSNGHSERLVGSMIQGLVENEAIDRAAVVVVSKAGYVQGDNFQIASEAERTGEPYPEMVKYRDGLWHCIHPRFLEAQLQRSLDRLQLETLDVLLLHNPEYFFTQAKEAGNTEIQALRDEFYRRMTEAFRYLESQVEAGRIQYYGVSSNTVAAPADDPEATSLASMLVAAKEAAGDSHHFRVLQLPLNLLEPGGVLEKKHEGASVIEVAHAAGIGVLVNRPLNAIVDERLIRLADFDVLDEPVALDPVLDQLETLEDEFRKTIAPSLQTDPASVPADRFFAWAPELRRMPLTVDSAEVYDRVLNHQIRPHIQEVVRALDRHTGPDIARTWMAWRDRYLAVLESALGELRRIAYEKSQKQSAEVADALDPQLPEDEREESLSRKALWVIRSVPGVTAVLVGMRRPMYVDDALEVLTWSDLEGPEAILTSLAR